MNETAPAKVNLCLFLGDVRSDGRHELVTLFNGGGLGTYTLPYNFSASMRTIVGPQF